MESHMIAVPRLGGRGTRVHLSRPRDEALARLVGNGSEWAFGQLYERYHQQLYRYCRSILRHDEDAHDALQTTFAAAYTALRDARRDAPMRPWLFRIAHNEAVSVLRRRRTHGELSDEIPATGARMEEQAADRERLRRLLADLQELPERQRSALIMRELSGMSHDSIALALRTSVGTAKQAIFEARRALADLERGRAMACDEVCRIVSDRDGRTMRARKVRAHLRDCTECASFAAAIPARSADLRALSPLAPGVAGALLARAMGGGASSAAGPGGGAAGIAGQAALGLSSAKLATAVVVLVATTTGGTVAAFKQLHPAARSDYQHRPLELRSTRKAPRASRSRSGAAGTTHQDLAGRPWTTASPAPLAGSAELRGAQNVRPPTGGQQPASSGSVGSGPPASVGSGGTATGGEQSNVPASGTTQPIGASSPSTRGRGPAPPTPAGARRGVGPGRSGNPAAGGGQDAGNSQKGGVGGPESGASNPGHGGLGGSAHLPAAGSGRGDGPVAPPGQTGSLEPSHLGQPIPVGAPPGASRHRS